MSRIPTKKSRHIVVDGKSYRWMLKGKSRFMGSSAYALCLTVQEEVDRPGDVLQAVLVDNSGITDNDISNGVASQRKASLTPADVIVVIQQAIRAGWVPNEHTGATYGVYGDLMLKDFKIEKAREPIKTIWERLMEDETQPQAAQLRIKHK